jgi:hypothetical protein
MVTRIRYIKTGNGLTSKQSFIVNSNLVNVIIKSVDNPVKFQVELVEESKSLYSGESNTISGAKKVARDLLSNAGYYFPGEVRKSKNKKITSNMNKLESTLNLQDNTI